MLSPNVSTLLLTGFPDKYLNPMILNFFLWQMPAWTIHVLMAVQPFYILCFFMLMLSVVPYSQPTTYPASVIMQPMMFFGKTLCGPNTGRRRCGLSQSTGHRALAIGWYALLIFHASSYSSLTALSTRHPGRRTSRYSCTLFCWKAAEMLLGYCTAYQSFVTHCLTEGYGPYKGPWCVVRTAGCCKSPTFVQCLCTDI